MDENLSRSITTYSPLRNRTPSHQSMTAYGSGDPAVDSKTEPRGAHNGVYIALLLAGSGFLLPYNSFVTAVDFYHKRFPGTTIIFDMSLVYICVAFISVCLVNCLVRVFSLQLRISFGYIVAFVTLTLVAILDIWYDVFDSATSYRVTLLAVAIIAFGSTAQQSSFYGYTSMLPPRYTQAVMTGESAAGLMISTSRIITKAIIADERINTIIFFLVSILAVAACFVVFHVTIRTHFVKYHVTQCKEAGLADDERKIAWSAQPEEVSLVEVAHRYSADQLSYGVLVIDASMPTVVSNNDYETNVTLRSDDRQIASTSLSNVSESPSQLSFRGKHKQPCCLNTWNSIKDTGFGGFLIAISVLHVKYDMVGILNADGLHARYEASMAVWPYMLSIGGAYFVTLCLFPGIESEVVSCRLGSWMPILLMAVFNLSDCIGKVIASKPYDWPRCRLVTCTFVRLVFIPLLMLCASPRDKPVLSGETWSVVLSSLLGLTNGYFGSVPMIIAPSRVPEEHREITGNIMMLSYSTGLTAGSIVAYLLDAFLGPQLTYDPCHVVPLNVTGATVGT